MIRQSLHESRVELHEIAQIAEYCTPKVNKFTVTVKVTGRNLSMTMVVMTRTT